MSGNAWGVQPNSDHQLWSSWTFKVYGGRRVPLKDVQYNAAKWAAQLFGTVGQMRVTERVYDWTIELQIEGVPAHDPDCVVAVRKAFCGFVEKGWGPLAMSGVSVEILAGDLQDGKPRQQVVVMPSIVDGGLS